MPISRPQRKCFALLLARPSDPAVDINAQPNAVQLLIWELLVTRRNQRRGSWLLALPRTGRRSLNDSRKKNWSASGILVTLYAGNPWVVVFTTVKNETTKVLVDHA
jgi:hypothetical protein